MAKILIIEDEQPIRENLVRFLGMEGFEVFSAVDGEAGIALAREILPDLVVCDILMPRKTGLEVIDVLKASPETDKIPCIFLSASADEADLQAGLTRGAATYLTKPFTLSGLLATIRRFLPE